MTAGDEARSAGGNLDRYTSRGHALSRFVAQHLVLKPVVWSLVTVTVIGKQNLKGLGKAFVVVANHSSHLDTPLILGALPRKLSRYLAAGAAADYFFDVWWRRGLTALFFNAFPVDRSGTHPRRISAKDLLKAGVPLLVFPEGTRSKDGSLGTFKPGAAGLAASAGVPAVPIALIGAHEAHPRGSNWPKAGRLPVAIVFGQPMSALPDESASQFMQRIKEQIEALLDEHKARILNSKKPEGDPE
ncbi:MAG TPA: lysophospholipid acyltransferase family protein [Pseudolysinimonas sp.]|nr:lysophospholipid acyltransferase family protein [Pseudolysinimonas sp.]